MERIEQLRADMESGLSATEWGRLFFSTSTPSQLSVNTMTLSVKVNVAEQLPRANFRQVFHNDGPGVLGALNLDPNVVFEEKPSKFNNAVMFKATLPKAEGTKVIKIFNSGNMQLNGVKTFEQLRDLVPCIVNCLQFAFGLQSVAVTNVGVHLINATYSLGGGVNLERMASILRAAGQTVALNFELHPGLRYKIPSLTTADHNITLMVFSTGKAIITGVKDFRDLEHGYDTLSRLYETNLAELRIPDDEVMRFRKRARVTSAEVDDFYASFLA